MPEISFEALSVLLILLPGFLCARVVRSLCPRPQQTELDKIIEALLYSFLIYVVYALIHRSLPLVLRTESQASGKSYFVEANPWLLLLLTAIALAFALGIGISLTNDIHGRILRRLRFTQSTFKTSVWSDTFHNYGQYVLVELRDRRTVLGWLRFYSDTPEESSLFLADAAWIGPDGSRTQIDGPGILLSKDAGILSVAFLKPKFLGKPNDT